MPPPVERRPAPAAVEPRPPESGVTPGDGAARAWHALEAPAVLEALGTSSEGLSEEEARRRLQVHGANVLEGRKGDGPLRVLWRQLDNPLIWVLLGSAALAAVLGKGLDAAVVLAVVVLNTLIGFFQEWRAGQAIEALGRMVPEESRVVRGGTGRSLPSAEVVPGDVVQLASGDRVPADGRLLRSRELQVEEAALTGESVPVRKAVAAVDAAAPLAERTPLVYGGTLVTSGTATVAVVATGRGTELGRISRLLEEASPLQTPLTRALAAVGRTLTFAILAVSVLLMGVGVLRGYSVPDALMAALALAVAAIPEGLPAIVTIALAIGVQRMARRQSVIRKLPAVETLGSTTVICTDKTGTLTRNEMTVQGLWTPASGAYALSGVGYAPEGALQREGRPLDGAVPGDVTGLLRGALLCNDASLRHAEGRWALSGDPTEGALVVAAAKAGLDAQAEHAASPRLDAIPFESEHQFMATLHRLPTGERVAYLKGAPEVLLPRCRLPQGLTAKDVLAEVDRMAGGGMRVLAVAERRLEGGGEGLAHADVAGGLTLLGLQGMIDPPRPEAVAAVRACHAAGITVKMMTGDHARTAEAIGAELGILAPGGRAVTGAELGALDDAGLARVAGRANVFARVAPEHKLRLVRSLQAQRHVVAMTGDGVNDAPALEQADIGVAMGITGTSVSKEAADMVLADDNFASIAAAVEEGRRVYDNLVKSLAFVLPTNLGLALILTVGVAFFPFVGEPGALAPLLAMQPAQLLWINLVATVALALPLAFEAREPDVMQRPPRAPGAPILDRFVLGRTALVAVLMAAGAVGLFLLAYREGAGLAVAQTQAVTTVIAFQMAYMLACRSLHGSLRDIGYFSNRMVFVGLGALALLQGAFIYLAPLQRLFGTAALGGAELLRCVAAGALILPVIGAEKWLHRRRRSAARG